ncbi:Z-ring formation inhibitor MciZ [Bacillus gobiensis]
MKIYRLPNGIVLTGKAWEIRAKLKEYGKTFRTIKEWVRS